MEITKLEKAALLTTGAGASFMTLLWNLAVQVDSAAPAIIALRIVFAAISFLAFDLALWAIIDRGWSRSGIAALIVTSGLSGAIGLEVAGVVDWPALHAAPALALAAFGAHLMLSRDGAPAPAVEPQSTITQAVQVNVGTPLPRTIAGFIAARAAEQPDRPHPDIAAELGTSVETLHKALALTTATTEQEATS